MMEQITNQIQELSYKELKCLERKYNKVIKENWFPERFALLVLVLSQIEHEIRCRFFINNSFN